jgi:small subunit ribosomal protein S1
VRTAEPRRFIFREDGGIGTISSVRRLSALRFDDFGVDPPVFCPLTVRLERAFAAPAPAVAAFFRAGVRLAAALRVRDVAGFAAAAFFADFAPDLARSLDAADFFFGRAVAFPAVLDFFRDEAALDLPPPVRFAMMESFRNLDSFAISVVLSDAYRKSDGATEHLLTEIAGRRIPLPKRRHSYGWVADIPDHSCDDKRSAQGMANVEDEQTPGPVRGAAGTLDRAERGDRGGLKALPREDDDRTDPEEYARLLDSYDSSFRNIAEGEVVKGTVLKVTASEVIVDVGYKSEGIIAVDEFVDENGLVTVEAGDIVDVLLERTEDRDGYVVLSREKAEKMKIWDEVEKAYVERKVVIGRVIERIKGGLAVDIGVRAFLPGSQIDVRPVRNLDALRGQELRMRVIKVNKKRGNIVLSRKALLEEENAEKKKHTLETLAEGKVLRGVVKNITDYGAFIDLGGIDGLLHITDMSWGRVGHPSELFKVNDEIDVVVLKYDAATERVSLGHKQLITDPWANVMDRYPVGARSGGKVVSLTDYGAFVELESGVEGLIHVSEMSWSKRVKHPSKILNVGDPVDAMVLGVDPTARRISLGLKQVESNPWHDLAEKYPVGSKIQGKVRNLTEFGAFVEVEEDIDGLIHISDMSWSKRIKHPSEVLKKGDVVDAMVLNIDAENQRLSLGLKQLATDIWDDFFTRHHVGDTIEGKVVRMTNFGAFVELDEGIEGLIHVSEFDDSRHASKDEEKIDLKVGETYPMKIIKLAPEERKIGLSIRALKSDEFRTDWETYQEGAGDGSATLGDHFRSNR